jgi:predicted amidohydrolase YtcJ
MQDGSIQGYTGFLRKPYFVHAEGKDSEYRGYSRKNKEALFADVLRLHKAGNQIAIHGNGDAAIDDILEAFQKALSDTSRPDARHRIEHCQMAREDQIDLMKRLGVTPSYFVGHVYYWGDRHREIFLGPDRGERISPLKSTLDRGVRFTLHDDTPVTPVNPLQLVWVAATRQTSGGKVLGEGQKISVKEALAAVTCDAAWQNFEEKEKGTLEAGKLADFVILDLNPLEVEPARIRDIQILETIIGSKSVFVNTK